MAVFPFLFPGVTIPIYIYLFSDIRARCPTSRATPCFSPLHLEPRRGSSYTPPPLNRSFTGHQPLHRSSTHGTLPDNTTSATTSSLLFESERHCLTTLLHTHTHTLSLATQTVRPSLALSLLVSGEARHQLARHGHLHSPTRLALTHARARTEPSPNLPPTCPSLLASLPDGGGEGTVQLFTPPFSTLPVILPQAWSVFCCCGERRRRRREVGCIRGGIGCILKMRE